MDPSAIGLTNAPAYFQRMINMLIASELKPYWYTYLDDIIIVTDTFQNHVEMLEFVLSRLVAANLTVNLAKCVIGPEEVEYLGLLMNRDGFRPNPEKIDIIFEVKRPMSKKMLMTRRLGFLSWHRKFLSELQKRNGWHGWERKICRTRGPRRNFML